MPDRKVLEAIVNRFYEVRTAGDRQALMAFAAPDFSFRMVAGGSIADAVQMGNATRGAAMLQSRVDELVSAWDMSGMRTERLYVDGDTVLAYRKGTVRYTPNGREIQTEYIDRFTFEGESLIDITEFLDTLLVAETAGLVGV